MVSEVNDIITVHIKDKPITKNKKVIVTCLIGNYEKPTDEFEHMPGFDYILYTDKPIKLKSWKTIIVEFNSGKELSSTKKQRFIKTHLTEILNEYELVCYVDANTTINKVLYEHIDKNKGNIVTFKKHIRNCVYDEINACIKAKKESNGICELVRKRLTDENYPKNNGLFENNVIVLKPNNKRLNELMRLWWREIYNYSKRDQLSLNYVIWKNHFEDIISVSEAKCFTPKKHKKK